jgi:PiT family inorganic phosphate transporter
MVAERYIRRHRVRPALYEAPKGNAPPPWWIRALLIFTCTGVSFAHGGFVPKVGRG